MQMLLDRALTVCMEVKQNRFGTERKAKQWLYDRRQRRTRVDLNQTDHRQDKKKEVHGHVLNIVRTNEVRIIFEASQIFSKYCNGQYDDLTKKFKY